MVRTSVTDIRDWIEAAVSASVREIIPEMFGSIKTKLIVLFYDRYNVASTTVVADTTVVVVAASPGEKEMPYS